MLVNTTLVILPERGVDRGLGPRDYPGGVVELDYETEISVEWKSPFFCEGLSHSYDFTVPMSWANQEALLRAQGQSLPDNFDPAFVWDERRVPCRLTISPVYRMGGMLQILGVQDGRIALQLEETADFWHQPKGGFAYSPGWYPEDWDGADIHSPRAKALLGWDQYSEAEPDMEHGPLGVDYFLQRCVKGVEPLPNGEKMHYVPSSKPWNSAGEGGYPSQRSDHALIFLPHGIRSRYRQGHGLSTRDAMLQISYALCGGFYESSRDPLADDQAALTLFTWRGEQCSPRSYFGKLSNPQRLRVRYPGRFEGDGIEQQDAPGEYDILEQGENYRVKKMGTLASPQEHDLGLIGVDYCTAAVTGVMSAIDENPGFHVGTHIFVRGYELDYSPDGVITGKWINLIDQYIREDMKWNPSKYKLHEVWKEVIEGAKEAVEASYSKLGRYSNDLFFQSVGQGDIPDELSLRGSVFDRIASLAFGSPFNIYAKEACFEARSHDPIRLKLRKRFYEQFKEIRPPYLGGGIQVHLERVGGFDSYIDYGRSLLMVGDSAIFAWEKEDKNSSYHLKFQGNLPQLLPTQPWLEMVEMKLSRGVMNPEAPPRIVRTYHKNPEEVVISQRYHPKENKNYVNPFIFEQSRQLTPGSLLQMVGVLYEEVRFPSMWMDGIVLRRTHPMRPWPTRSHPDGLGEDWHMLPSPKRKEDPEHWLPSLPNEWVIAMLEFLGYAREGDLEDLTNEYSIVKAMNYYPLVGSNGTLAPKQMQHRAQRLKEVSFTLRGHSQMTLDRVRIVELAYTPREKVLRNFFNIEYDPALHSGGTDEHWRIVNPPAERQYGFTHCKSLESVAKPSLNFHRAVKLNGVESPSYWAPSIITGDFYGMRPYEGGGDPQPSNPQPSPKPKPKPRPGDRPPNHDPGDEHPKPRPGYGPPDYDPGDGPSILIPEGAEREEIYWKPPAMPDPAVESRARWKETMGSLLPKEGTDE